VLPSGPLRAHAIRLGPGEDLVASLQAAVQSVMAASETASAFVLTAVGSLSAVTLRLANASRAADTLPCNDVKTWDENVEIVSLIGTFTYDAKHIHVCVSTSNGETGGGHLVAATILTTVEIVLGTIDGVSFDREWDDRTGYRELVVKNVGKLEPTVSVAILGDREAVASILPL
jgi:uncharacterized protein